MKIRLEVIVMFVALGAQNVSVQAQGVYVTRGEKGPVFSDQPQPGAKEVTLRPLNVMTPPPEPVKAAPSTEAKNRALKEDSATLDYRRFSVIFPENDGSVIANTAVFEVRLAVEPPLQLSERHAFVVSINGRPVGQRFTATEFMIPPEFWGDQLPPANQSMQLDASIVDGSGVVLKQAASVRFYMRHATIRNHPRRPLMPPVILQNERPHKQEAVSPVGAAVVRSSKGAKGVRINQETAK